MDQKYERYLAFMGKSGKYIPHYEMWSNPDAETYLTGIDYYDHPKQCREKLAELYPQLYLPIPETDTPKPRPSLGSDKSSNSDARTVRWGDSETTTWEHGEAYFKTVQDVFDFSPLEKGDFRDWPHVVMNWDYSTEEAIYERALKNLIPDGGDPSPTAPSTTWFYNTMFMWPLLTFGWELFLETCLEDEFERIMAEFAEINRRVFKIYAQMPVNFIICHDDIAMTSGPVCSPAWMNKYIFPLYEEFWSILKDGGKEVIYQGDGNIDAFVDDIIACGARGIITEPYTDFKKIAKKYPNIFLAGEGDNRILSRNNPQEIKAMVDNMAETAKMNSGYAMSIGNHIPWNVPPEAVKLYLDYSAEKFR